MADILFDLRFDGRGPVDVKYNVADFDALYSISAASVHPGEQVFVQDQENLYKLTDVSNISNADGWTLVVPGSGSEVIPNPAGTDGDDLTRIDIDGTNFNIPGGGSDATITLNGRDGIATIGSFDLDQATDLTLNIDVDGTVLRTTGNESISGIKDFTEQVILSGDADGTEGLVGISATGVLSRVASIGDGFVEYTSFADLPGTDATPPAKQGDLALVLVENATYPAYMWFDETVGDNGTWISTGMVVDEGNGLTLNATTRRLEMNEATATQRGTVGIGAQTFGGDKTFDDGVILAGVADNTVGVVGIAADGTLSRVAAIGGSDVPDAPARDTEDKEYILSVPTDSSTEISWEEASSLGGQTWSQNDGTPISPTQIDVDTTGALTYVASDGVITLGAADPTLLKTKITGGTDVDTTGIDINSNELSYAITSGVATFGLADTVTGGRTFQFADDDNDAFTIETTDGTDLFRVTGTDIEINNSADIIIHQGDLTESSVLQKLVFVEGESFDAIDTGFLNATQLRLFSRWSNGASGFDLPELHTSTVSVAFDTDDADDWITDSPAFALYGTANHNNATRTVYDLEVHTRGDGTNVDSRFVFKTMNDNSQVDALFIEHDRIRPQLATIFEDKLRFDEKTTTELAAIASPLEGDVYYNTTDSEPQFYDGTNFVAFASGGTGSDVPDAPDALAAATVYQLQVPATGSLDPVTWVIPSAAGGSAFTTNISATLTDPTLTLDSDEGYADGNETGRINFDGRNSDDDDTITYASIFVDNTSLITIGDTTNTIMNPGTSQFKGNTEHIDDLTETDDNEYNASSVGFVSADGNGDAYVGASIHEYIVDRSEDETELHFFAGDGNAADELLLNLGQTRAHFGDLDSEIQDRTGDLDAQIRLAYPLNTWSFQTNDFYRYKPVGELGAIQDTFLNDRAASDKIPLYISLTQGRWNLKDNSSDATNVTDLVEVRHEYNQDTNDRWGSHIITAWTGDRDGAAVTQYDTIKVTPGGVQIFGDENDDTDGDVTLANFKLGDTYVLSFSEVIISGSAAIADDKGDTTNNGDADSDTTVRAYVAYYYLDGVTYYRVRRNKDDDTDATGPWGDGTNLYSEQIWTTSNNDTRVVVANRL